MFGGLAGIQPAQHLRVLPRGALYAQLKAAPGYRGPRLMLLPAPPLGARAQWDCVTPDLADIARWFPCRYDADAQARQPGFEGQPEAQVGAVPRSGCR